MLRYVMFMFKCDMIVCLLVTASVNVLVNVVFVAKVVKVHVSAPDTKELKTKSHHM